VAAADARTFVAILNQFLSGVRVVDLSRYLPGPFSSLLLADMGATVFKVEPPAGDEMKTLGPRDAQGHPVYYEAVNAGKTVLTLDLKRAEAVARFIDLIKSADILIEGFRPGVMARLGLDYEVLKAHNPGLIYCAISGYGESGPLAQAAGHDGNYLGLSGVLDRNGNGDPIVFDPPIADTTGSLFAVIAMLGALHARRQTGKGCKIDLALADVVMPLQLFQLAEFGTAGTVPRRESSYLNGGAAYYRIYRTADGRHVMLGAIEPKFWKNFCDAAGHPEWIDRQNEPIPQRGLIADVAQYLAGLTSAAASALFGPLDCCFSPVLDLHEAATSPHHANRGLVRWADCSTLQALFPAIVDGQAPGARPPLKGEA
jgi:crotonobetainyl-CoA:carnitine CoA-transferase CaiB-like acyl-CoA transferase